MAHKDFATGTVLTAPSPATSGTSLVLNSGEGDRMPATPFMATAHPDGELPTLDNAEQVEVTAVSTDTLTITRAQGDTTAKSISTGWRITASLYAEEIDAKIERAELPTKVHTSGDLTLTADDMSSVIYFATETPQTLTIPDGMPEGFWFYLANPSTVDVTIEQTTAGPLGALEPGRSAVFSLVGAGQGYPADTYLSIQYPGIDETGAGDVVGPASSTDNALARFDGTTGKLIKNSSVTVDDFGNMTLDGDINGIDLPTLDSDMASKVTGDGVAKLTVSDTAPSSPSDGDLWVDEDEDDDNNLLDMYIAATQGTLGDTEYFTSSGTWTKPDDLKFIVVEVVGGGGAGGGISKSSGQAAAAGSGGAGGYSRKKILAANLSATETVTVGAGASATAAGNNNGAAGGTSSFGSHCSATGGAGGTGMASSATAPRSSAACGEGGAGSGGDLNVTGGAGIPGIRLATDSGVSSIGGSSFYSGSPVADTVGNLTQSGFSGKLYGGGGNGAVGSGTSTSSGAGGAGANGIVIVHEYF